MHSRYYLLISWDLSAFGPTGVKSRVTRPAGCEGSRHPIRLENTGARSSVVELRTFNPGVVGSNPTGPSIVKRSRLPEVGSGKLALELDAALVQAIHGRNRLATTY